MGLTPKPKGRKSVSNSNKTKSTSKVNLQDDDYAKLLKRLAYLEAENDYLKKLDALIRQKEQNK
ncbi:Uncharacterised protein [Moraxella lacunata]|uniref:Uncharacterized protein n=1 Tax=Moraxella lacunata TaxID=477 RepID=A0A378TRL4_MORLA|nr:Uncharacterised protein [Moraxella lacunata]